MSCVSGVDIAPGMYQTDSSLSDCYWERLSDVTGSLDDIIANDIGSGSRIVQIEPTDAFGQFARCGNWSKIGWPAGPRPGERPCSRRMGGGPCASRYTPVGPD